MSDLYPTRTRLALLQDVDDGRVVFAPGQGGVLNLATNPPRRVVGETAEMRQAGWIDVDISEGADTLGSYPYALTDKGRGVLAGAGLSEPAAAPANPDRRCHRCAATSGLRLAFGSPLTLDYKQYECADGCAS